MQSERMTFGTKEVEIRVSSLPQGELAVPFTAAAYIDGVEVDPPIRATMSDLEAAKLDVLNRCEERYGQLQR